MKIGLLYGGQGSQLSGMGEDFYQAFPTVKNFYDKYPKIKELSFNASNEELSKTSNTQPCMLAFDIVLTDLLKAHGLKPAMLAGLSVGEYGALYCSNTISQEDIIKIAYVRGQAMEDALEGKDTMMCACIKVPEDKLRELCLTYSTETKKVELANFNCPNQVVVGGDREKLTAMISHIREEKFGKVIPLKVSGAFHTSYMEPAGAKLRELFEDIDFGEIEIPVVFNVNAREKSVDEKISDLLIDQVKQSVLFQKSIEYMIASGVDTFIEIGFGSVLAGFVKKISRDVKVLACNDIKTFEEVLAYTGIMKGCNNE